MHLPRRFPTLRRLAATFSIFVAATLPAFAQGPEMPEADKKALLGYKLTLERVDKINAVSKKLVEAAKADPQIAKEMQAMDADKGSTFDKVDEVFGRQAPHVVAVIKSEGLEPHEYILGMLSTMFASMGAKFKASGTAELPDFIPPANVELAEKNPEKFEEAAKSVGELDSIGKAAQ